MGTTQAQENEWLIEPIITSKIGRIIPDLKMIEVSDGKMRGVKNFKNEVIIPLTHSHISVFLDVSYIAANKGSEKFYYDHDGYEIDESVSEEASKAYYHTENKRTEK